MELGHHQWDITKLLGPAKWTYFYLYVFLPVRDHRHLQPVRPWLAAGPRRARPPGRAAAAGTIAKQHIARDQLVIHADRGASMASKPVAFLLADLGITKSHSRPHCSNGNPCSGSQFKTMKYRPESPGRFGSYEDALGFCRRFFTWYNDQHRHSGIGWHVPAGVHYGRAAVLRQQRAAVLDTAYLTHPERSVRKPPQPPRLPAAAWINQPNAGADDTVKP